MSANHDACLGPSVSQCMKADVGNLYASFLPGISVTLCKIITGDTKQGFAVTSVSFYLSFLIKVIK